MTCEDRRWREGKQFAANRSIVWYANFANGLSSIIDLFTNRVIR